MCGLGRKSSNITHPATERLPNRTPKIIKESLRNPPREKIGHSIVYAPAVIPKAATSKETSREVDATQIDDIFRVVSYLSVLRWKGNMSGGLDWIFWSGFKKQKRQSVLHAKKGQQSTAA